MIRVLAVDDHPIVREGLAKLFALDPRFAPLRHAASAAEIKALLQSEPPDVLILDLSLGQESGLDVLRSLRAQGWQFPVVVLSMHDEAIYAERVLQAGAQAYLMKQTAADYVVRVVHQVLSGEIVVSQSMQSRLLARLSRSGVSQEQGLYSLSNREVEVLRLMGQGLSTAQIAARLQRSVKTIETHRAALKKKLGLRTGLDLVHYAARWQSDAIALDADFSGRAH